MTLSLRYNGAIACLLLGSGLMNVADAGIAKPNKYNSVKAEFMQSMKASSIQKNKAQRKRQLYKNIVDKAVPAGSLGPAFLRQQRKLDDGNAYYADEAEDYGDYGFDVSSYSLKYAGCSAIATYSDAMAQADDEVDSVFSNMNYVIFRLCPTDECSDSQNYGCSSDYGEYMLPMGTWLEIMAEYREEEFERYCTFCENCMALEGRRLDDAAADGDDAAADGDDAAAAGDDAAAAEEEEVEEEHACTYYNACSTYADVCGQRRLDDGTSDVADFFDCQEVETEDSVYYVGPHCSSDKNTIVLGMFKDQYCTEYMGADKLYASTGLMFASDAMATYYKDDCIACKESDLPYEEVDEDAEDSNEVTAMCEYLYTGSAKCNRYIGGATAESYTSDEQEDNSKATCSYISSVVTGHYDEDGFIYSSPKAYRSDNKNNKYLSNDTYSVVTVGQVFGLIIFSVFFLVMWLWSCFLRNAVTKKAPWRGPNKDINADMAAQISRQNSGIGMARSKSFGAMA